MKTALRKRATLVVWLAAVMGIYFFWHRTSREQEQVPGTVEALRHQVASMETARVKTVFIQPGSTVTAGQPLVALDSRDLDAQLQVARSLLEEQLAAIEAQAQTFKFDTQSRRVELETRLATAQASLVDARSKKAAQDAELNSLSKQLKRLERVEKIGLTQVDRVSVLRARQARLAREAGFAPDSLRAYRSLTDHIGTALERIESDEFAVRLRPYRARADTQSRRIDELLSRREQRVLKAPVAGQVVSLLHTVGDTVNPGDSILEIIGGRSDILVAYVPEEFARRFSRGAKVEVRSVDHSLAASADGIVENLAPEIIQLPPRFWFRSGQPRYGRPIRVRLEPDANLMPGEIAMVRVLGGGAQAAGRSGTDTRMMSVPSTLAAATRLEVSGAVWLPERQRFVVVSDDTGLPSVKAQPPWVFTVNSDGQFDPTPMTLSGAGEVSDLEAIAQSPDGHFYLLCSQSRSRKGKRPAKRQRLLRAVLEGNTLRVTGQLTLYALLEEALTLEQRAHLSHTEALDIEGMTWLPGKGLLLGLKAPNVGANAVIWLLENVSALLDAPSADRLKISKYGELHLPTGPAGAPGGISDLLVEGNSLYVLSTLASGPASGAAWKVDLALSHSKVTRLAQWPDHKPEGIGVSGTDKLMVFFDTGDKPPRFTTIKR